MSETVKDFLIIKDSTEHLTAVFGNIQWFVDDKNDRRYEKVLLRDITDDTGYIICKKEWFMKKFMINLAKKNLGKKLEFTANVKQILIKGKKGPEPICEFTKINNIRLMD